MKRRKTTRRLKKTTEKWRKCLERGNKLVSPEFCMECKKTNFCGAKQVKRKVMHKA